MQLFHVTEIEWDWDDDGEEQPLPKSAYVHAEEEDDIAGILSDEHGFAVKSLVVEPCTDSLVFAD